MSHILHGWVISLLLLSGCSTMPPRDIINRTLLPSVQSNETVKSYLYGGEGIDSGMSIACGQDGSCLLFGETDGSFDWSTDYLAVKISPDQKIVWAKKYDGSGADRALEIVAASDGGYLLVGISKSMLATPIKSDVKPFYPLIIKVDTSGNIQWAKAINYKSWTDFYIYSAIQSSDNAYVISGYYEGKDKKDGTLIFKLTESGELLWANYYRPSNGLEVHQFRVIETSDQKLSVLFSAENTFGLFVTDSQGKPLWARMFKGEDTKRIWAESVTGDQKGGFVLTAANCFNDEGGGQTTMAVLRLTAQGKVVWGQQYSGDQIADPYVIMKGYDNDFVIAGVTGKNALGFVLGYRNLSTSGFALLIDEDGKQKSIIPSEKAGTGLRSVSRAQGKYFLLGDTTLSKVKVNWLLSVWEPRKEAPFDAGRSVFPQKPFKVKEEEISIESKPAKLDTIGAEKQLRVRELKVNNGP